jgi:hypothetical protein
MFISLFSNPIVKKIQERINGPYFSKIFHLYGEIIT